MTLRMTNYGFCVRSLSMKFSPLLENNAFFPTNGSWLPRIKKATRAFFMGTNCYLQTRMAVLPWKAKCLCFCFEANGSKFGLILQIFREKIPGETIIYVFKRTDVYHTWLVSHKFWMTCQSLEEKGVLILRMIEIFDDLHGVLVWKEMSIVSTLT